jgi:hypothetical protein
MGRQREDFQMYTVDCHSVNPRDGDIPAAWYVQFVQLSAV